MKALANHSDLVFVGFETGMKGSNHAVSSGSHCGGCLSKG